MAMKEHMFNTLNYTFKFSSISDQRQNCGTMFFVNVSINAGNIIMNQLPFYFESSIDIY